jgi:hypothetical protein
VIAAPDLVVGVGGDFEVTITITNSVDLAAYQFTVSYDPTIIEFVSAANSPYLESTGRTLGGLVGPWARQAASPSARSPQAQRRLAPPTRG